MRLAGVPLAEAVRMATEYPARLMNVEPVALEPGSRADLALFRLTPAGGLDVTVTVVAGEPCFGSVPE